MFTWLLPALLGYARGGMAWVGLTLAAILTLVLPVGLAWPAWNEWYWQVHYCLYGVFFLNALAGLSLCAADAWNAWKASSVRWMSVSGLRLPITELRLPRRLSKAAFFSLAM